MILLSSHKVEREAVTANHCDPSQQMGAACGDPGGGEIPMRLNAQSVSVFPKGACALFLLGGIVDKYKQCETNDKRGGRFIVDRLVTESYT